MDEEEANFEKNSELKRKVQALAAQDGELLSGSRSITLLYRPDLSRKIPVAWAQSHYYWVYTFQVRPGRESVFEEAAKRWLATYDKAGLKNPWFVYQSLAGLPDPSFTVIMPMNKMCDMDGFLEDDKAFAQAAGEEGLKAFQRNAQEAYVTVESTILAVSPKMSYAPPEIIKEDPAYWKVPAPGTPAKKVEVREAAK